ncbi:MAG: hypothetical protein K1000chlam3_00068 [Chlamydiae bacterium]|nr:hypothetical protein [Chlamydiota bacterium]
MDKILVIGTTGVIGNAVVKHCSKQRFPMIGLSRKAKASDSKYVEYISADITSNDSISQIIQYLKDITVVVYAAFVSKQSYQEETEINHLMFSNVISTLIPSLPKLKRVLLIQGLKAYGAHLGPFKTPAVETDPRPLDKYFYFTQEDLLKEAQIGKQWTWTILRPDAVCGTTAGFPMNIALLVAVYASISKELGLPLKFPGSRGAYEALVQVTDSDLLAQTIVWASQSENCKSEIINIANGDYFRWENIWPKVAKFFHIEVGLRQQIKLSNQMPLHENVWNSMIEKYQLQNIPLNKVVAWSFGDFLFNSDYDVISNLNHLRKLGFDKFVDTEEMFLDKFRTFKENKIIP